MNTKIGVVYKTDNFEMFKVLNANRDVKNSRKQTLIKSIKKYGYIPNPIIVNEDMMVIDGQGRLAACKELGIPVCYTIVKGIGIDECMVLNANMRNWAVSDFIKSYAEQGNADYQRIYALSQLGFNFRVYMWINGLFGGTGATNNTVNEGNAVCTENTFKKTLDVLNFLKPLIPCIKAIGGRESEVEKAIAFAYCLKSIDNNRLKDVIEKRYSTIAPPPDLIYAIAELEKAYNYRLKTEHCYLSTEFDKHMRQYGHANNKYRNFEEWNENY